MMSEWIDRYPGRFFSMTFAGLGLVIFAAFSLLGFDWTQLKGGYAAGVFLCMSLSFCAHFIVGFVVMVDNL